MRLRKSFAPAGAGTRDLLVAEDARRASWLLMARPLGLLWFAGGSVVEVWLALYGDRVPNPGVTLAAISLVSAHLVSSLRGSHGLIRRAFEDAPLGMAFMDREGRWIATNGALRALLGRSDDELAGTPVAELLDAEPLRGARPRQRRGVLVAAVPGRHRAPRG